MTYKEFMLEVVDNEGICTYAGARKTADGIVNGSYCNYYGYKRSECHLDGCPMLRECDENKEEKS
jgi:hypothetical protein